MADKYTYFDDIIAKRAALLSEEEWLVGESLVSIEAQGDEATDHIYTWIHDHFADFLPLLRHLSKEDQEIVLGYFGLGKAQKTLGKIHGWTQTIISSKIRMAVKHMLTYMLLGEMTEEVMREILVGANLEYPDLALAIEPLFRRSGRDGSPAAAHLDLKRSDKRARIPLSRLVWEYSRCRDFQRVADAHELHRPDVRRAMRRAAKALLEMKGRENALGSYLFSLIEKASACGVGLTSREHEKRVAVSVQTDPPIVGQFRVDVTDPDFKRHMFVSRAGDLRS